MKRLIFGILLFVTAAVEAQDHPPYWHQRASLFGELPVSRKDIIFLGNSITDGCEWGELFGNPRIKNRGISGDTTDGILERLDAVTAGKPAKIFIMIGTNDLSRGKSVEETAAGIGEIVERIAKESPSTLIYLQSVLPVTDRFGRFASHTSKGEEIGELNSRLRTMAEKRGIAYIDLHSLFADPATGGMNIRYTNDGLHLTGAGYLLWRDTAAPFVKESKKSYRRHLKQTQTDTKNNPL